MLHLLKKEPILIAKRLENIFQTQNPKWTDVETLLDGFLTHSEKNRIISLANKKQLKWPETNPHWNANYGPDYIKLCQGVEALLSAIKTYSDTPESWVKLQETEQEINETPSQFMDRLIEVGNIYIWTLI